MIPLTKYEKESIINYNAGEQTATVYTRDKTVMRKLDKLVADFPDTYKLINQTDIDKTYSMPKSYVTYRKPRKLSDAQREQARQKMVPVLFNFLLKQRKNGQTLVLLILLFGLSDQHTTA